MSKKNTVGLSRRKALLGLGTIGAAGAGAGVGTSALFSDEESFTDNTITAGTLDLVVDYATSRSSLNDSNATGVRNGGDSDPANYEYVLEDVKPGDSGGLVFCPKIIDNPGYLWIGSNDGPASSENGYEEPEPSSNDELDDPVLSTLTEPGEPDGTGELENAISANVYAVNTTDSESIEDFLAGDPGQVDCDPESNDNLSSDVTVDTVFEDVSLAALGSYLESGFPIPLDESAYPASEDGDDQEGPCICIEWNLPAEVGNAVQGDSYSVDFQFVAVQARNNANDENPFAVEVGSESELVTALQNSDGIKLTSSYRSSLPTASRNNSVSVSAGDFDRYNFSNEIPDNAPSRSQYAYIRENGQVRLALAAGDDVYINQSEDGELVLVLTDQPNTQDWTLEEIQSGDDFYITRVDASISS